MSNRSFLSSTGEWSLAAALARGHSHKASTNIQLRGNFSVTAYGETPTPKATQRRQPRRGAALRVNPRMSAAGDHGIKELSRLEESPTITWRNPNHNRLGSTRPLSPAAPLLGCPSSAPAPGHNTGPQHSQRRPPERAQGEENKPGAAPTRRRPPGDP